jgi:hypothetical protein
MNYINNRKFSQIFLLISLYFIIAAASFHGYFSKWAFRDVIPLFSLNKMLDGTADKPFVYRQLVPQIANSINKVTPNSIKEKFAKSSKDLIGRTYAAAKLETLEPKYMFRYAIIYIITYTSLLISMFLLREICIEISESSISGTIAPIIFALSLPFLLTRGGYFYDFFELMFFSGSFLLTLRKRIIWILPIALIATFNKESFFLFVITLIPLIRTFTSRYKLLSFVSITVFIAAIANIWIKSIYINNPGNALEYHFIDNIGFYLNPFNYLFAFEINYGLLTPKGFSIFGLLASYFIISQSWSSLKRPIKQHVLVALCINIPLFIIFCWRDELRNLSMLFISFTAMISIYIKNILRENYQ